jgi:hypothetical protein
MSFVGWMSWNGHFARLLLMKIVSVASGGVAVLPTILFDEFDEIAIFHS